MACPIKVQGSATTPDLHAELNEFERQYSCVKNVAIRYFLMLKALKNKQRNDKTLWQNSRK